MHKFSPSAGFLPRQSCFSAAHRRDDNSAQVKDSAFATLLCSICPRHNLSGLAGRGYTQHLVFYKDILSLGKGFNQLVPPSMDEHWK